MARGELPSVLKCNFLYIWSSEGWSYLRSDHGHDPFAGLLPKGLPALKLSSNKIAFYHANSLNKKKDLDGTDHKAKVLDCEQWLDKTQKFDSYVLDTRMGLKVSLGRLQK